MQNKHLVTAAVVAPILALIGYFGINALVGESPQAAEEGQSYQLVEMPSCRYSSGHCGLKNSDFELDLTTEPLDDDRLLLLLKSEFPLEGVKVALIEDESDEEQPVDMRSMGEDGLTWSLEIARPDPERNRLHLVASANQSLYFGDAAMKFTLQEDR
jgi:hypothetical protein